MTAIAYPPYDTAPYAALLDARPAVAQRWGIRLTALSAAVWAAGVAIGFERAITILTVVGLATAVVGVTRPAIGLLGIGILCTIDGPSRVYVLTGGLLRWNTLNYWLLLVSMMGYGILAQQRDLSSRMIQSFVLLLTLQLTLTPDLPAGLQHMLGIIAFFGLFVYFARAANEESVWYWMAVVNGVTAAAGGLVYYLQQDQLRYINANAWAFFPLTAIFTACLSVFHTGHDRRGQLLLWMLVLINFVWVVLSGSRGGSLIAVAGVFFLISAIPRLSLRVLYISVGVLLGAALAMYFATRLAYVQHRLDKSIDAESSLASRTSGRSDLAIGGWRMFLANPLVGAGTGGFAVSWAKLDDREGMSDYRAGKEAEAHSGWIKTLAEAGLPGFLLHAAFVLSFAIVGWKKGRGPAFYLGLLVTTSLTIAFISTEFQAKGIWFFCAGAIAVLGSCREDEFDPFLLDPSVAGLPPDGIPWDETPGKGEPIQGELVEDDVPVPELKPHEGREHGQA